MTTQQTFAELGVPDRLVNVLAAQGIARYTTPSASRPTVFFAIDARETMGMWRYQRSMCPDRVAHTKVAVPGL